jgi:hypothetical protein
MHEIAGHHSRALAGLGDGLACVPREEVQDFLLHALDFGAIATCDEGEFFGPSGDAQLSEKPMKVRNPVLCDGEFSIVANHALISTIPRLLPSRLIYELLERLPHLHARSDPKDTGLKLAGSPMMVE